MISPIEIRHPLPEDRRIVMNVAMKLIRQILLGLISSAQITVNATRRAFLSIVCTYTEMNRRREEYTG